jgi:hypothetical protein
MTVPSRGAGASRTAISSGRISCCATSGEGDGGRRSVRILDGGAGGLGATAAGTGGADGGAGGAIAGRAADSGGAAGALNIVRRGRSGRSAGCRATIRLK